MNDSKMFPFFKASNSDFRRNESNSSSSIRHSDSFHSTLLILKQRIIPENHENRFHSLFLAIERDSEE